MTWVLGALLLGHSLRCLIADSFRDHILTADAFVLCFISNFIPLQALLTHLCRLLLLLALISCQRKIVPPVDSLNYIHSLYANLISHPHVYFRFYAPNLPE